MPEGAYDCAAFCFVFFFSYWPALVRPEISYARPRIIAAAGSQLVSLLEAKRVAAAFGE